MPTAMTKAGLVASIFAGFGTAQAHALPKPVQYACPASQRLTVQRDNDRARVSLAGRTYDLQRKHSSIGDKYLSSTAALIIDGGSAVFVAGDHSDVETCVKGTSLASLR